MSASSCMCHCSTKRHVPPTDHFRFRFVLGEHPAAMHTGNNGNSTASQPPVLLPLVLLTCSTLMLLQLVASCSTLVPATPPGCRTVQERSRPFRQCAPMRLVGGGAWPGIISPSGGVELFERRGIPKSVNELSAASLQMSKEIKSTKSSKFLASYFVLKVALSSISCSNVVSEIRFQLTFVD